jgi:hypothetical protein
MRLALLIKQVAEHPALCGAKAHFDEMQHVQVTGLLHHTHKL